MASVIFYACYGKNTRNGQRTSCPLCSIAGVALLSGRETVTPIEKLHERLGWQPRVPMKQAMARFLAQFDSGSNTIKN